MSGHVNKLTYLSFEIDSTEDDDDDENNNIEFYRLLKMFSIWMRSTSRAIT